MIDNFSQIRFFLESNEILKLSDSNEFYFIQIIQRAKDNNCIGPNNRLIKSYSMFKLTSLADYEYEIKELCKKFNARAYIHITKRNIRTVTLEMLKQLAEYVHIGEYHGTRNLYNSICGKTFVKDAKTWIIDIDSPNEEILIQLKNRITELIDHAIITKILTKNGFHMITMPFDTDLLIGFLDDLPDSDTETQIDIHKNNPTVLYIPDFNEAE